MGGARWGGMLVGGATINMAEQQEADESLYCVCRRPYAEEDEEFMIECEVCRDWFHGSCVGIQEHQVRDIDSYHCPNCESTHGPLTLKRRRNYHRHDHYDIADGTAVQSGTAAFIRELKKRKFDNVDEVLLCCHGNQLTVKYLEEHGFSSPVMVCKREGLGLVLPPGDITIADIEKHVGSMRELDVIDVARQDDIKMTMREWTQYYEEQAKSRKKVLNVISLEFSDTSLSPLVAPPTIVRQIDWINVHWPSTVPEDSLYQRPQVQKYCLMGIKNSYTDFHVDFGGTSVWYHVVRGEKVFYLIAPSEHNLALYEQWVLSANQSEIFFGSQVKHCYKCRVLPGNTLFIPTGWIHAVLTPEDSLVFGGNFLHHYNIGLQLRVYEMELRLATPHKFRHPSYEALTWFAARDYLTKLTDDSGSTVLPQYLLNGLKELVTTLSQWIGNRRNMKIHQDEIPSDIKPVTLLSNISQALAAAATAAAAVAGNTSQDDMSTDRSITLTFCHGQVTRREKDGDKQHITMKLSVPQAMKPHSQNEEEEIRSAETAEVMSEDDEYQDEQYVYGSLVSSSADTIDKSDETWRPHGPVYVRHPNTSRPNKRNAIKKSFEKCLQGTAAKLKGQEDLFVLKRPKSDPPCAGHGQLLLPTTAAATIKRSTTVDGSKSRTKPKTAKQRLGKILGLDKSGRFMRK